MKILRQARFLAAVLILISGSIFETKSLTPPISVKVVNAPRFLVAGKSSVFTLEIQNTDDKDFTFSLLPGFRPSVCWEENRKSGRGAGGCTGIADFSMSCTSSTGFDPQTGELICKTSCYKPKDFISLQPRESRRIDVTVDAPEKIQSRRATATVNFQLDSNFDGKDLNLKAWTGTFEFEYKLPLFSSGMSKR